MVFYKFKPRNLLTKYMIAIITKITSITVPQGAGMRGSK